jgi:hypothetical protein
LAETFASPFVDARCDDIDERRRLAALFRAEPGTFTSEDRDVSRRAAVAIHMAAWPSVAIGGVGPFGYNASNTADVRPAFGVSYIVSIPVLRFSPRFRRNPSESCA